MKISIMTIVFNAESTLPPGMLTKNIEQWMDIDEVCEIIIVEGATRAVMSYPDGSATSFTADGKSTDKTRDILCEIESKNPDKIKIILADEFWDGKTSMCNVAAHIATGDYIWQVDSDEFYHENDIPKIIHLLNHHHPDAVHFYANHFFGGYTDIFDKGQPWGNGHPWMRIFRHLPGSSWISHEPPEYKLTNGQICNQGIVINRDKTLAANIRMYHYSYVCQSQVDFKAVFFCQPVIRQFYNDWQKDKKIKVFNSVTSAFVGNHPSIIKSLIPKIVIPEMVDTTIVEHYLIYDYSIHILGIRDYQQWQSKILGLLTVYDLSAVEHQQIVSKLPELYKKYLVAYK